MKKQSNLSRLLGYAGRHRYLTYASWALSAASALLALVPYWYIWRLMGEVLAVAPHFSQARGLVRSGCLAVLFAVIAVLVYIAGLMCSHMGAFRIATNLRIEAMRHIVKLPLGAAEQFGSGRLRKIVNESSAATETYLAHQLPDRAGAIATPIGLLALLLVFDWRLGLLSLVPVALGFLIMTAMTGSRMQQKMKEYQNALEDMSNEAVEYIRGIPVVKTFGQTIFSFKKFKDSIDRYKVWVIAYTKQLRLFQSENAMIVDDALQRIDSVLDLAPLSEPTHPQEPRGGTLEVKDVCFHYEGGEDVIKHVSLTVPAGQTAALVGPSGGGKTTLAHLIARFFDPQSGAVRIGGVDVRDMAKERLMDTVSFVFQDSRLIKASILDNVRLGRPEATREEVLEALHSAQCGDILEKLPQGVDTVIGAKGVYLSGGEQQRIAIARAMLKNAPVLILDEATASLDVENETLIQGALSRLIHDKTVLVIAHRMRTVAGADKIVVLDQGVVAEQGSPGELMKRDGIYARMVRTQTESQRWALE